jgi:hypothetical protein
MREISGHDRFFDGKPAVGILVSAGHDLEDEQIGDAYRCSKDGSYTLEVPEILGSYRVSVDGVANDEYVVEDVEPGTSGLDFVLPRVGHLRFRLRDAITGEVIGKALVRRMWLARSWSGQRCEIGWRRPPDERYQKIASKTPIPGLVRNGSPARSRRVLVRASHLGYRPAVLSGIELGEESSVEVELEPGLVANFVLDPESDSLHRGSSILLLEAEGADGVRSFRRERIGYLDGGVLYPGSSANQTYLCFDTAGVARLTGLAPGLHRFKVLRGDFAIVPPEILLAGDVIEPISILCQAADRFSSDSPEPER